MQKLLEIYRSHKCLYEIDDDWSGFEWINADDADRSIYSFFRKCPSQKKSLLFVLNMTPVKREGYRVGVPVRKQYKLLLNSTDLVFGGSGETSVPEVIRAKKGYKVVRHEKSHESAEDYLENILILRERNGNVRSIDIVNEMNYSKPSISIAMKKLRTEGYVEMDLNGYITLTESGEEIAQRIYSRHQLLEKVLVAIGVDQETLREHRI